MRIIGTVSCLILTIVMALPVSSQNELPEYRIGFLEGGEYPQFDALRDAYRTQLIELAKDDFTVIFPAKGYRTAAWKRDSCKAYASQLASMEELDLIVAMGAWAVHDLLEAGCTKPIVAAHQYDPVGAGLLGEDGRPIAENLTLTFDPFRIERELSFIMSSMPIKKLGLLHFPSGGEIDSTGNRIGAIVNRLGGELIMSGGNDNFGTYAFFKAYSRLANEVDAVYITPTFGLTTNKTSPFFSMVLRDRLPLFSSEGRFHASRGGMIGLGSDNMLAEAYYNAHQTYLIMQGATPASLSIAYQQQAVMTVNRETLAACKVELPKDLLLQADQVNDGSVAGATFLDLATAIDHGLAADPTLGLLRSQVEMMAAQSARLTAESLPQISITGKFGWQGDNAVDNSYGEAKSNFRSIGIGLSQQLLDFGHKVRHQEAVGRETKGEADRQLARGLLKEGITLAYYEILKLDETLAQFSEYRRRLDLFVELILAKEQSGEAPTTERLRWQYERLQATQKLAEIRTRIRIARASFNILIGQPSATEIELDPAPASTTQLIREYSLAQPFLETERQSNVTRGKLVRLALANNPVILKNRARLGVADRKTYLLDRSSWPKVELAAGVAWRDSLADLSNGFSESSPVWSAGLRLDWPLWQGGLGGASNRYNRHRFDRVGFAADAEQMKLIRRVYIAAEHWMAAFESLPLTEELVSQSTFYLNEMTQGYIAGEVSLLEAKDGLDIWLEAQLNNTNGRYGYFASTAKLLKTIGSSPGGESSTAGESIFNQLSK